MPWLWFAGPLTFFFVVVIFNLWPTDEERRVRRELMRWLDDFLGPLWDEDGEELHRQVDGLKPVYEHALEACGRGARIADVVLVPDFAYLAVRGADAMAGSNHYTVVCKLGHVAPSMVIHPLAIVDGRPVENDGVVFKDTEFMAHYVVEAEHVKGAKRFLNTAVRDALLQFPELWVRVTGSIMTISFYGSADAETLDELIEAADGLFAEHGAAGGETLFGDPDLAPAEEDEEEEFDLDVDEDDADVEDDGGMIEVTATLQDRITAGVIDYGLYAIGVVLLVAVLGYFPGFHPSILFNSPDLTVAEPWQGGWTTKGFGALVFVETYLLGIFSLQAHLAVRHGQSVGKRLVGIMINTVDGEERSFVRVVLLRKWIFLLVPAIAALAQARPIGTRAFFNSIPTKITGGATLAIGVVLLIAWLVDKSFRGLHDRLARTEVVQCERYRIPSVQLAMSKNDPIVGRRLVYGACFLVAFLGANFVTLHLYDAWLFEVHQWK